jgi:ABC-2 type transport system ATP-binding protein
MTIALEITKLIKQYDSGVQALKNIDLVVEQGDFFALLGPNGAGKSTTIGIASSLVNKTSGTVKIFGYDLDTQLSQAKQKIGVVPQEFNFNQFEKVEHILITQAGYYGVIAKIAKERAEKYLKLLGLWDKRNEVSRMLSGGMKRRLMIARALMNEPELLILDEPTAGVDIEMRRSMWDFLIKLNKEGTTIILTTHYLEEAESLCRNIAIIDKGKIVENTSMRALIGKLKIETFVFDCEEKLDQSFVLPDFSSRIIDLASFEASIKKGQTLNELFSQLDQLSVKIKSMRNKSNRLEELFLSLVDNSALENGSSLVNEKE